jgi:hypothetical protein
MPAPVNWICHPDGKLEVSDGDRRMTLRGTERGSLKGVSADGVSVEWQRLPE